jgi:hypothetical protein
MTKFWLVVDARQSSCFDKLSTNGKRAASATATSFALSLSKGEQQIYQEIVMHPSVGKSPLVP